MQIIQIKRQIVSSVPYRLHKLNVQRIFMFVNSHSVHFNSWPWLGCSLSKGTTTNRYIWLGLRHFGQTFFYRSCAANAEKWKQHAIIEIYMSLTISNCRRLAGCLLILTLAMICSSALKALENSGSHKCRIRFVIWMPARCFDFQTPYTFAHFARTMKFSKNTHHLRTTERTQFNWTNAQYKKINSICIVHKFVFCPCIFVLRKYVCIFHGNILSIFVCIYVWLTRFFLVQNVISEFWYLSGIFHQLIHIFILSSCRLEMGKGKNMRFFVDISLKRTCNLMRLVFFCVFPLYHFSAAQSSVLLSSTMAHGMVTARNASNKHSKTETMHSTNNFVIIRLVKQKSSH